MKMKVSDFVRTAKEFANYTTCYLKGGIGKYLDQAWYDSLLKKYPDNAKYGNGKDGHYVNTDCFEFDCITFVKSILAGCTIKHHLADYSEYNKCPIGDCTTKGFKSMLYDTCVPRKAEAGYGLATDGHAGISLGNGVWIDCNWDGKTQNGVAVHYTGIERFDVAGKIPTIDYEEKEDEVKEFLAWLYEEWKGRKK